MNANDAKTAMKNAADDAKDGCDFEEALLNALQDLGFLDDGTIEDEDQRDEAVCTTASLGAWLPVGDEKAEQAFGAFLVAPTKKNADAVLAFVDAEVRSEIAEQLSDSFGWND